MPVIMIIGDGMADLPLKELGGKTPLQFAETENIANLTLKGRCGLIQHDAGNAPDSEAAITCILGYPELSETLSRGPLEALGSGVDLDDKSLAFRCNFALADSNLKVLRDRADVDGVDLREFFKDLSTYCSETLGVEAIIRRNRRFKAVMTLKGDNLSPKIFAPPPSIGEASARVQSLEDTVDANRTSMIINSVIKESHNILMRLIESSGFNCPANILIPWGVGRRLRPEPFRSRYGLKAACIAGSPLAKGIGIMLDMTVPKVAGATGYADTDTDAKAEAALKMCRGNDYVMLHVGGPDEASHDGDPASKVKIISKLDTMLGRILTELNLEDNLIILLADHTTSTALRRHTTHPTPIVMAGMHIVPDGVRKYDERSVAGGGLGKIHMKKVMSTVTEIVK
ncbi:MAG: alkaline phosphatase family protein [Candidatus Bathyarchaeia archaeon]|nr:hypothetical protein [Candidatus Bathyarchaeota archaeon]